VDDRARRRHDRLAFLVGTLIGLVSAWRRGSWLDNALPPIFIITSAFPYFWVGLILIYLFAIRLGIFPQQGAYNFLNDTPACSCTTSWTSSSTPSCRA
jgi:peptide/nickel transport system permease protein